MKWIWSFHFVDNTIDKVVKDVKQSINFTKFKKSNIEKSCFELSYELCQLNILYELPYYVMKENSQICDRELYVFLIPSFHQDFFAKSLDQKLSKSNVCNFFHFIWWTYLNYRFCNQWSSNMANCKFFTTMEIIQKDFLLKWTYNCYYKHSINKSNFTTNRWILEVWNRYIEWMLLNSLWLNGGNFDTAYD